MLGLPLTCIAFSRGFLFARYLDYCPLVPILPILPILPVQLRVEFCFTATINPLVERTWIGESVAEAWDFRSGAQQTTVRNLAAWEKRIAFKLTGVSGVVTVTTVEIPQALFNPGGIVLGAEFLRELVIAFSPSSPKDPILYYGGEVRNGAGCPSGPPPSPRFNSP